MIDIVRGDCRTVLRGLDAGRFRACVTSPPYWEQREYLPAEHPDKALEIGHEATPALYIAALVEVFREVRRTLTDDGTLWINIGDKYANDGKWGGATGGKHASRHHGATGIGRNRTHTGLPPKSLMGMPWRLAFALQDDGWILRSDIIWHKPNAMPAGGISDRPTSAHEHVFLLSVTPQYFFDQDAVREPHAARKRKSGPNALGGQREIRPRGTKATLDDQSYHPLGRNVRDVWEIGTEHGDGAHAAPMPLELARRCVRAGSAPGDHVLDPFGGSGTVGLVTEGEGRHATLIELDDRAVSLARGRTAQTGLFAVG